MDQCTRCTMRGNIKGCLETPCNQHESWMVIQLKNETDKQVCIWQQDGDEDSGAYRTACGNYFMLDDGTPEDNKMGFCCYCGKSIEQHLVEDDDES